MEINEVYNHANGSNKGLEQTIFSDDFHESYNNHGVQLLNNNNVEKGNLRQPKQQLEDRVLFRYVPKHVINVCEPAVEQTIRVFDLEYGREMPFHARLPSGVECSIPSKLELFESQASISDSFTSSLSECSPMIDETRGTALISGSIHASGEAGGVTLELKSTVENTHAPESSQVSESVVFDSGLSGEENSLELQEEVPVACNRTTLSYEVQEEAPVLCEKSTLSQEPQEEVQEACKKTTLSYQVQEEVPVLCKKSSLSYEAKPDEEKDQSSTPVKSVQPCTRSFCEADKEFEFLNAAPVKRCSSLKSSASSGSLTKKKEVRFADVLGLDLESVQLITSTSEPPVVSRNALRDLKLGEKLDEGSRPLKQVLQLCPCFSPHGHAPDFAKKVYDRKVMLETLTVDDANLTVSGSICVVNIAYVKRIFMRYTTNGWLTYDDLDVTSHLGVLDGGRLDKFLFKIKLPESFGFGSRMEFAISYESGGQVYWDNNFKANYRIECYLKQLP